MDELSFKNLDVEFKRYLQIMRLYLGQLENQDAIDMCTKWIQRLSNCTESEKKARNKYVFTLCFQLAKGALDEPFLQDPPEDELSLTDVQFCRSDSISEVEYQIINPNEPKTNIIYNNKKRLTSETEDYSQYTDFITKPNSSANSRTNLTSFESRVKSSRYSRPPSHYCYTCPKIIRDRDMDKDYTDSSDDLPYESRANNLIIKLREIKKQNTLLYNELNALKRESNERSEDEQTPEVIMVDNTTSVHDDRSDAAIQSLKSIKCKLLEVQDTRQIHMATISQLQEQLDNLKETKSQEIQDLINKHKEELLRVKATTHEECKKIYDELLAELKHEHEKKQTEIKQGYESIIKELSKSKDEIIRDRELSIQEHCKMVQEKDTVIKEKDSEINTLKMKIDLGLNDLKKEKDTEIYHLRREKDLEINNLRQEKDSEIIDLRKEKETEVNNLIKEKDAEIANLKKEIEEQKNNLQAFMTKFIEKPGDDCGDALKGKAHLYEKRLSKMERAKLKCAKSYEAKLAMLQREKHLTECSLQLQLVRQRAQVVNEIADENQEELMNALEKLESKYKEIVANVQATAIQRRVQDQKTLETVLMAACGVQDGLSANTHFNKNATMMSSKDANYDSDFSGILRTNLPKIVKKSFDEECPGYCLDGERLEELIQKVYIPQRDTTESIPLKRN